MWRGGESRGRQAVQRSSNNPIAPRGEQRGRIGDSLDPALRSWVDNCIVPILVKEYVASLRGGKKLADADKSMAESGTTGSSSGEVKQ